MECLKKPIWNKYTREELKQFLIEKPEEGIRKAVLENWDAVAKPMDGMGRFETLTAQLGAITGTDKIDLSRKAVLIMCADNGIVDEKVSQSGQEVTLAVAKAMGKQQSSVGRMAAVIGADTIPVDIGINSKEMIPGVLNRKIRCGTRNFRKEPAMTEEETMHAIAVGIDLVGSCKRKDYKILATGEMGIGNTTTSSAIAAAVLQCEVSKVTGKGAGLSDEGLYHKKQIIEEAIKKYDLYHADALKILQTVGGLDIAGLVGVFIGGAALNIPLVIDGFISAVAALVAVKICPAVKSYIIPSHLSKEPAAIAIMKELNLKPFIDCNMCLGEGTGAVAIIPLLDMALSVYGNMSTFEEINVDKYEPLS